MSYKERARAYFSAVNNYDASTIEQMVEENYIQHNPLVPTGRAAFLSLLPKLKTYGSKIRNVRMIEDGQHVIMHHRWENATPFGHDYVAAFHIIRFDAQGLIAEHWSVMTKDICGEVECVSLTDGTTRIEDFDKTNVNRRRVEQLFTKLCDAPQENTHTFVPKLFHDRLLRLNLNYRKQHKVFAEGNFVLSISEATSFGVLSAVYDLFRFDNESIVEHWGLNQEIPTKNLANNNTMFGF